MAGTEALPARNHYVVVPETNGRFLEHGLQFRIAVENIEPYMAFCPREDAAEMIAGALNAQVPVDALAEPLTNWQLRDIAAGLGQTNTVKGVVLLDMDDILHGIEAVNDLACERLAGLGGSRLQDIRYKVVGNALFVEITADASELLAPEETLTEECQNCQRRFTEDEIVNPIPDLVQRVLPGEPMPSGECPVPECRAVCHTVVAGV